MGAEVKGGRWSNKDRQRYREKVRQNLDVVERMLAHHTFDSEQATTGFEIEMGLVGADYTPSRTNAAVLAELDDPLVVSEIGRHTLELNIPPRTLDGTAALSLESELTDWLGRIRRAAATVGSRPVVIGVLPTLMREDLAGDWMTPEGRYVALDQAILRARGEDIRIDIDGDFGEPLRFYSESIAPESACTSLQLHLQVAPERFAQYWNAAQAIAGVQVALGANSPYVAGRALWHESRIELFRQAADTRSVELANQGVRPRVVFGDRWITSIFDLLEENVSYYPALLPEMTDEDPVAVLAAGEAPQLKELMLHNGTIYRWNRPIYDTIGGRPHLRIENRVLPAGPTVVDMLANAAFYYGLVRRLGDAERPIWTKLSASAAATNFRHGYQYGMQARLYAPGYSSVGPDELALRLLLPIAAEGLRDMGVAGDAVDRYLGVMEGRCATRQNGASWQIATVQRLEESGKDRAGALRGMLERYVELSEAGEPVHTWPVG